MAQIRTFRDLIAWQRARELAAHVYDLAKQLPKEETFGLGLQMRRAAVSVASNIAEGFGRNSRPEFIRFLRIARGSIAELSTQLTLVGDLRLAAISPMLPDLLEETDRVIGALIRSAGRKATSK